MVVLEDIASCDSTVLFLIIIETMTGVILRVQLLFKLNELLSLTS